jgi:hypothetical protein
MNFEMKVEDNELYTTWQVRALTNRIKTILKQKQLPYKLYLELKKSRDINFFTQEYLDEMDEFTTEPGWFISEKGKQRIKDEAIKTMSKEQSLLVDRINKEVEDEKIRQEMIKKEQSNVYAILDEAYKFSKTIPETDYRPVGEKIDDPRNPPDIYGGGHWWVIEENRILTIYNNGSDGADWSHNNIRTGGAGAIGKEIGKTDEILKALEYVKTHQKVI